MSDTGPRKVKASLLERAAEVYDFAEHARARGAPVEPQPIARPLPIAPVARAAPRGGVAAIDRALLAEFAVPVLHVADPRGTHLRSVSL